MPTKVAKKQWQQSAASSQRRRKAIDSRDYSLQDQPDRFDRLAVFKAEASLHFVGLGGRETAFRPRFLRMMPSVILCLSARCHSGCHGMCQTHAGTAAKRVGGGVFVFYFGLWRAAWSVVVLAEALSSVASPPPPGRTEAARFRQRRPTRSRLSGKPSRRDQRGWPIANGVCQTAMEVKGQQGGEVPAPLRR